MIATILLLVNLGFLFFKNQALFNFLNFIWIYPLEIGIYIIAFIIWLKFVGGIK